MTKGKRMPKTTDFKSRSFNKAVSTEYKYNTAMNAFNKASNGSRSQKVANFVLGNITPYKDVKRATQLGNKYSDIKRAASGKAKKYK